eukprot:13469505-Ditylum_brightwellii.AAC.1
MASWAFPSPSPKKSKPTNAHSDNLPFAVSPDKNVPQSTKAYLQGIAKERDIRFGSLKEAEEF